jgi:hypothetical protein
MEYWSNGVMEYWSIGVLEYWSIGDGSKGAASPLPHSSSSPIVLRVVRAKLPPT